MTAIESQSSPLPIVSVRDLAITFGTGAEALTVLDAIELDVARGEFIVLIGPSGCGKTTLLRAIADLVGPTAGTIQVNGMHPHAAREAGVYSYVFQSPTLFPWRRVLDNVCLPMDIQHYPDHRSRREAARRALARVGLEAFAGYYPNQLSGGMQMRVSIARALVMQPNVLLMDEPFGALDEVTRESMNHEVRSLCDSLNQTTIFVTHSLGEAAFLADRVVMLSANPGRIAEVMTSPLSGERDATLRETTEYFEFLKTLRRHFRQLVNS